ncbi:hypothetical protein AN220_04075, partial [Streptomyces nanshensis]
MGTESTFRASGAERNRSVAVRVRPGSSGARERYYGAPPSGRGSWIGLPYDSSLAAPAALAAAALRARARGRLARQRAGGSPGRLAPGAARGRPAAGGAGPQQCLGPAPGRRRPGEPGTGSADHRVGRRGPCAGLQF